MIQSTLSFLGKSAETYPREMAFPGEHAGLTYHGLSDLSMRIGSVLTQKTGPRRPVPVLTEKNVFTLGAFMGTARAGCFYACLDADQPAGRLNRILDTLKADLMIAGKESLGLTVGISFPGKMLFLEDLKSLLDDALNSSPFVSIRRQAADTDPLYEIFTSGSTGAPKGVTVGHRSVINFIQHFTDLFHITQDDVIGNQAPFDSDVSIKDIYSVLKTGATMGITLEKLFPIPADSLDYLRDKRITTAIWVASALCIATTLKGFTYRTPPYLNKVLFGGEVMSVRHSNIWHGYLSDALFANLYDPTEITCSCTYYVMDRELELGTPFPIGVPSPNGTAFLLDESNRLVTESGQNGKPCVAGTALTLGYCRDPGRTTMVFAQNPLNPCYPEIIYKTGDLACYGRDGLLYFNGRKDFQIEHMGYRIEFSGVEAALETVEGVDRAVYLFLKEKNKTAAFYKGATIKRNIAVGLEHLLPCCMFSILYGNPTKSPRTKDGKVDQQALRRPYG